MKKNVALLVIATNKYTVYLDNLIKSVGKHFLKNSHVHMYVFTDNHDIDFEKYALYPINVDVTPIYINHMQWPFVTLLRYHTFRNNACFIPEMDYLFYIDVDTRIVADITEDDILSPATLTQHCGYVGKRGTYENRVESTSYMAPHEGAMYYGGGFWGMNAENFWTFIPYACSMLDTDIKNKILPIWDDESILNRYWWLKKPSKVLSPSFHYPENDARYLERWPEKYKPVILLLEKNHKEIRN